MKRAVNLQPSVVSCAGRSRFNRKLTRIFKQVLFCQQIEQMKQIFLLAATLFALQ